MYLTRIDGIDVTTALAMLSETGTDMSRFATVGHFTIWLGLCPGTKIIGGKVMSGKTKRVVWLGEYKRSPNPHDEVRW